jgi:hypothetical protein
MLGSVGNPIRASTISMHYGSGLKYGPHPRQAWQAHDAPESEEACRSVMVVDQLLLIFPDTSTWFGAKSMSHV